MKKKPTPDAILELTLAFWGSKTLLSAVELGLFTELAKGPRDKDALRVSMGINERSVEDFLDALVALGMLDRKAGKYRNTPETDLFLDRNKPTYIGGVLEMANERLFGFGIRSLRASAPACRRTRLNREVTSLNNLWRSAETPGISPSHDWVELGLGARYGGEFPWRKYRTFIDVGGAQGGVPVQIALKHRHLTGEL
jgi:Dimerisation domain